MANDFYERTFNPLPGQRVDEQVLKDEFQRIEQGFDDMQVDADRAIKLPVGTADQTLAMDAGQRANLVLAFDASGNITAVSKGRWRGDWVTATAYVIGDSFRYAPTGNIYSTLENHTSGVFATDLAAGKFTLAIDGTGAAAAAASAAAAATSASNAATSESNAAGSASSASGSAASAAASFDTFDDIFLGAKAFDPTTDNDGNALQTGALYFNTTAAPKEMRVYDGSAWAAAYLPAAGYVTLNGTQTLTNKTISLTNNTVLAGNLPVIRPTLLLDFANSLNVDPRITFTRASAATRVNQFGLLELVASGASRIDYDPVTLACRGLLVEEARTNLVLNSVLAGTSLATQSVTVAAVPHTLSFYGTGTVTLSGTSSGSLVGSGAYPTRSTLTFTPTAGSLTLTVTGSVQFAQLEVGAFATSFIPTAGSAATRAADVAVMTGTNFSSWFSANEGTFVTQTDTTAPASGGYVYSADRGSAGPRLQLNWSSTTVQNAAVVDDASALVVSLTGTGGSNAFAYKLNDFAMAASGTISTDTVGGVPSALTRLVIGASPSGVSQLNGHIRSIAYYPKRLTNTELQALSTL